MDITEQTYAVAFSILKTSRPRVSNDPLSEGPFTLLRQWHAESGATAPPRQG